MKQKHMKKQFNTIKKVNHSGNELLEHIKNTYNLTSPELKQVSILQSHLLNMNVLFNDIEKGMQANASKIV